MMIISQLVLKDFRNYQQLQLSLGDGLSVFWGGNAQGKTNLLEAVHVCCLGKSHRTVQSAEMVSYGKENAQIGLRVKRHDGPRHIQVMLQANKHKRISVSGVPIRRMSELMGHVQCVLFAPEDLQLIKGGPSLRRKYMDTALCQMSPAYFSSLMQYNAALSQRNALLKKGIEEETVYDAYEQTMAHVGAKVLWHRQQFCIEIEPMAARLYSDIANGEPMRVMYRSQVPQGTEQEIEKALTEALKNARPADKRRYITGVGPHRDDLQIVIRDKEARSYASQGQQRTAVLALKLAEVARMQARSGHRPVLMLDDVLSELDLKRQQALTEHVEGQVLLTTATRPPEHLKAAKIFKVEQGKLTE
ncbi:MAG: DNA replication/repair protein RecF [Christensenellales bacterium]|jgi:DNA replication and repair protein RecF